jgi:hypothetical protein
LFRNLFAANKLSVEIGKHCREKEICGTNKFEVINTIADNVQQRLLDLKEFNNHFKILSLQQASEKGEIDYVRRLYGIGF